MSITDELRQWIGAHYVLVGGITELIAIVDRIDEKHRHAIGYVDDRDPETMAENGWIRLPKDADGEYIHIGDVMEGYGKTIEVVELRYGRSGWALISRDGNGYADTFAFAHHHKQTVEDVLREMMRDAACQIHDDGSCEMGLTYEQFDKYAQRLQLRESTDD